MLIELLKNKTIFLMQKIINTVLLDMKQNMISCAAGSIFLTGNKQLFIKTLIVSLSDLSNPL
jgi:hypothetical protein